MILIMLYSQKEAFRDRKQWKLAFETDMEPSASEFLRLNEFCRMSCEP